LLSSAEGLSSKASDLNHQVDDFLSTMEGL